MSYRTDCYIYHCQHRLRNGKCKLGWKLIRGLKCPAPTTAGIIKKETELTKGGEANV